MRLKMWKLVSVVMWLCLPGGAVAESLSIGVPNWPSVRVTASVLKAIVEREFKHTVSLRPASNRDIFVGMDAGDGSIDVHPEVWLPNQEDLVREFVDERGSVALGARPYHALQGLCVTKKIADEHGVKSVYDLLSRRVARLFDTNGDGKGEIWIGAQGWASTDVERARAYAYGYDEGFELVVLDEALALSRLDYSVASGLPYLFFCYAPHHVFLRYELVRLAEPKHDPTRWRMVHPTESDGWLEESVVGMAWPPSRIHIGFSRSLRDRLPAVTALLNSVELDTSLVGEWTHATVVDGADVDGFAERWVQENRDRIDAWLIP